MERRIFEQKRKVEATDQVAISEKLVNINRVAKVVKGGKHLSFAAVVVVGDGRGSVGMGIGKAREVAEAIRKASTSAKKKMSPVLLTENGTIPHEIAVKYGASKILMKPAKPGTGIIAGGGVRAVMEVAGVKNILTKSLGSSNPINVVRATILGLQTLRNPVEEVRRRKALPARETAENA